MKKPKFLLKVDHNYRGKVYINKKWLRDVTEITIHGEPCDYSIDIVQYKRDNKGRLIVEGGEFVKRTSSYRLKEKGELWRK